MARSTSILLSAGHSPNSEHHRPRPGHSSLHKPGPQCTGGDAAIAVITPGSIGAQPWSAAHHGDHAGSCPGDRLPLPHPWPPGNRLCLRTSRRQSPRQPPPPPSESEIGPVSARPGDAQQAQRASAGDPEPGPRARLVTGCRRHSPVAPMWEQGINVGCHARRVRVSRSPACVDPLPPPLTLRSPCNADAQADE